MLSPWGIEIDFRPGRPKIVCACLRLNNTIPPADNNLIASQHHSLPASYLSSVSLKKKLAIKAMTLHANRTINAC